MSKAKPQNGVRVGDWVWFDLPLRRVRGQVIEDRGFTGRGGRRLLTVELPVEPDEPMIFVLGEEDVEPEGPDTPPPTLSKPQVLDYLKNGGLVGILMTGTSRAHRPRAWLCPNTLGNPTHTFREDRGLLGGAVVPYLSLFENHKILRDKVGEVTEFLKQFGLDDAEAAEVIRAVGTARGGAGHTGPRRPNRD